MSRHRFVVVANVIDFMFEEHDGDNVPPPNDLHDWESTDLEDAVRLGLVDSVEVESYEGRFP